MSHGQVATLSTPVYAQYLAKEFGYQSSIKFPCAFHENLIHGSVVAWFTKGIHWWTKLIHTSDDVWKAESRIANAQN